MTKKIIIGISIIIVLLIVIFLKQMIIYAMAPKSYNACLEAGNRIKNENSSAVCTWQWPDWLFKTTKGCNGNYLVDDGFSIHTIGCYFKYLNPQYEFPENYNDCLADEVGNIYKNNYHCSLYYFNNNNRIYNTQTFKNTLKKCETAHGFMEGEKCTLRLFSSQAHVPTGADCYEMGGHEDFVQHQNDGKDLWSCTANYNSEKHPELFKQCSEKPEGKISSGVNNTQWCTVKINFEEKAQIFPNDSLQPL